LRTPPGLGPRRFIEAATNPAGCRTTAPVGFFLGNPVALLQFIPAQPFVASGENGIPPADFHLSIAIAILATMGMAVAASANFPVLLLSIFWRRFNTAGAVACRWAYSTYFRQDHDSLWRTPGLSACPSDFWRLSWERS